MVGQGFNLWGANYPERTRNDRLAAPPKQENEMDDITKLPDGSAFGVLSMPLPETHWVYQREHDDAPPIPMLMGKKHPDRAKFEEMLKEAGKYAIRSATMHGQDNDFDPDALIQNLIVGFLGYHTETGLSELEDWMNPPHLRKTNDR